MIYGRTDTVETATSFAGEVANVRDLCDKAVKELISASASLPEAWKGEAGTALVQAISDLRYQTSMVSVQLMALEGKIRQRASYLYNNWPKESRNE